MKLTLVRTLANDEETIGELYVDDKFECYTLEDVVRDFSIKVHGSTAIPYGTYDVIISYSPRFGRYLPLLLNVPNFTGVRIHSGNTHKDTEGCILVGVKKGTHSILESRKAFAKLYNQMVFASQEGQPISIEIKKG
jgi:hypothetical protein